MTLPRVRKDALPDDANWQDAGCDWFPCYECCLLHRLNARCGDLHESERREAADAS